MLKPRKGTLLKRERNNGTHYYWSDDWGDRIHLVLYTSGRIHLWIVANIFTDYQGDPGIELSPEAGQAVWSLLQEWDSRSRGWIPSYK